MMGDDEIREGAMQTIQLTARAGCDAGHGWRAGTGLAQDTQIVRGLLTDRITISVSLDNVRKCPDCGREARVLRFEAAPYNE